MTSDGILQLNKYTLRIEIMCTPHYIFVLVYYKKQLTVSATYQPHSCIEFLHVYISERRV